VTRKTRKPVKKAAAKRPVRKAARKPARKAARRPQPATSFMLKELRAEHLEVLRRHFEGIQAHEWRLVVDAEGRAIPPPVTASSTQLAPPDDQPGTTVVMFAMVRRTDVAADG
jgi:hypothetical protein